MKLPSEQIETRAVDRLLDQLEDIADDVFSRSKTQAIRIRNVVSQLREAVKEPVVKSEYGDDDFKPGY
jgi:hypothetical protein